MIRYSIKSLIQDRSKLLLSVLGVAVAILLILVMDGIFAGTEKQLTVYIDNNPVDVFVVQDGVKNMHMAKSTIPASYKEVVENIKGVKRAAAVNYITLNVKLEHRNVPFYLIGWDQQENMGGPWIIVEGKGKLKKNETIIDKVIANKHDLKLGDKIEVMGQKFKIVGMTEGTFSMASSILFFDLDAFKSKLPPATVSYLLVQKEKGIDTKDLAVDISKKLKGADALTKAKFAKNERTVAKKMGVEVIAIMTFISILAAIGVVALSIYSATLEKIRDFGVLKAIGANKRKLYIVVISQSLFSTMVAFGIGILLSFGIAELLDTLASEVLVVITLTSVFRAFVIATGIGIVAAYLPVRQIAKVDPVMVFKG